MVSEMQQRNEKGEKQIQKGSEGIGETEEYDTEALTLIRDNRICRIKFDGTELEG